MATDRLAIEVDEQGLDIDVAMSRFFGIKLAGKRIRGKRRIYPSKN